MTSSGTTSYEFEIFQIVEHGYALAGLDAQKLGYGHHKRAREVLTLIFADWQNRANFPWKQELRSVTLTAGDADYTLAADITDILDMVYRDTNNNDVAMERIAQSDYLNIPNKTDQGRPDRWYLRRDLSGPTLFIWQTPDAANAAGTLQYYCLTQLYDPTASAQTMDIAKRWAMAVVKRLGYELMPYITPLGERGADYQNERTVLRGEMSDAFDAAIDEDRDTATSGIYPEGWNYPGNYNS